MRPFSPVRVRVRNSNGSTRSVRSKTSIFPTPIACDTILLKYHYLRKWETSHSSHRTAHRLPCFRYLLLGGDILAASAWNAGQFFSMSAAFSGVIMPGG